MLINLFQHKPFKKWIQRIFAFSVPTKVQSPELVKINFNYKLNFSLFVSIHSLFFVFLFLLEKGYLKSITSPLHINLWNKLGTPAGLTKY